ncbi:histone deacetylase complex subunit SAP25 [Mus musculus]|uniref:Sin3 associated polypeptide n=1 Tax=Mus musculus TaxID=10090 RepID=E9Q529_MOUSE|nr:histone deacetylase complex subunit SAP25 [Mus musculus]|eukprot:NP_001075431.2 histone deacetylase complex subunit SAP25 [Mus musculus]
MGILLVLRLTQVSIRKGGEWGSLPFPSHSSQPQALSPSEPGRKQLPPSRHLATEPTAEAPVRLSPRVTSQVTPSRMSPLPLRDPSHQANAGPRLVEPSCGPGVSLSNRTLCHPSWPMYDNWGRSPTTSERPEEEQVVSKDTGVPVRNYEDVFLLDPLLPCGQRVPLILTKPPQQAMDSRKLLLPPPIMSPSVHPSSSQACSSTWLSEAEMIALAGLLQMSQGEQTPNCVASSLPSTSCPDPVSVSEDPGPSGDQSCSGTDT